jgi:hypothetical protein
MINTNDEEIKTIEEKNLFEGFSKEERLNLISLKLALDYYKPMVQGKDFQDIDKVKTRAKEFAKFIEKGK